MNRDTKRVIVVAGSLVGVLALIVASFVMGIFHIARATSKEMQAAANLPDPVPEKVIPPADPGLLSKPADPWTVPPVPIKSVLLVMPFRHDDLYDNTGRRLCGDILHRWAVDLPRDVAIAPRINTQRMISKLSVYTTTNDYRYEKPVEDAIVQFTNPTHLLKGTWREADGSWIIDVEFFVHGKPVAGNFRVPSWNNFQAAQQITEWMLKVGEFGLDTETTARLSRPIYGPSILSVNDATYLAMLRDPGHPEWDRLMAVRPDSHGLLEDRMGAAVDTKDKVTVDRLDPGVLGPDAPAILHLIRLKRFEFLQMDDASRHELELLMAKYPGLMSAPREYVFDFFSGGQYREHYIEAVSQWHQRFPKSSQADSWLAAAHKSVAWDYRGRDWASTVSDNAWQQFHSHNEKAAALLEQTLRDAPPTSYACSILCDIYGSDGPRRSMLGVHERFISQWPDCVDTWNSVLNFTRPRWGGSNEEAMALIDRAMTSRPLTPAMGTLALNYHYLEARLEFEKTDWSKQIREYATAHPDRARQLNDAAARLAQPSARAEDAAVGLLITSMLNDSAAALRIVNNHPDVHQSLREVSFGSWYGTTMCWAAYAQAAAGHWDQLDAICRMAEKDDTALRQSGQTPWDIVFWDPTIGEYLRSIAEAMTGDPKRGIARLEAVLKDRKDRYLVLTYLRLKFGQVLPADADARIIEAGQEDETNKNDALCVRALIAFKNGDKATAGKLLDESETDTSHTWGVLREDAWKTIKGTTPPAKETGWLP